MINHLLILNHFSALFGPHMHAKRVISLASATLGVLHSRSLAIYSIGEALSHVCGLERRHAIKQIDRLLTNTKLNVWQLVGIRMPYVVNASPEITLSVNWLEFNIDGHSTLLINMHCTQGTIPLLWKTYRTSSLHGQRPTQERLLLTRLKQILPENVSVTVLVDTDQIALVDWLVSSLGFHFIVRIDAHEMVGHAQRELHPASDWLSPTGRTRTLKDVEFSSQRLPVARLYCYCKNNLKEPSFLASSKETLTSTEAWRLYTQHSILHPQRRHRKDMHALQAHVLGSNMGELRITSPLRRDRLLLLSVLANDVRRDQSEQPESPDVTDQKNQDAASNLGHRVMSQPAAALRTFTPHIAS